MRDIRLLSNRVKVNSQTNLDPDRYNFLNLENAEPNLGAPTANNGLAASDSDGTRKWLGTDQGLSVDLENNLFVDETTVPIDPTGFRRTAETNLAAVLSDLDFSIGTPYWVRVTANHNAELGESIIADSIGGSFTVFMPPSPNFGDWIRLIDPNSWQTNPVTLDGNGATIEGGATYLLDRENTSVDAVYDGTTWQLLVTTGPRGYTGSQGPRGYTGSQGIEGLAGGVSFIYQYDTAILLQDPGPGRISLDNLDFSLAAGLAIDDLNIDGVDISDFLQTVDDSTNPTNKGHITLTSRENRENFVIFEINGLSSNPGTYTVISVNYVDGVTSFIADEEVIVSFVRTGDRGYAGSQGIQGETGFTGSRGFNVTDDSLNGDGSPDAPLSVAKLATPVDININGEVIGSSTFDGSADITITTEPNRITELTRVLTLTDSWIDVGVSGTDLETGTYIVQVYLNDSGVGGNNSNEYVSGIMSWYQGTTDPDPSYTTDEIPLHRAGTRSTANVFLRTFRSSQASGEGIKLQIFTTDPNVNSSNYVFKFRKLI